MKPTGFGPRAQQLPTDKNEITFESFLKAKGYILKDWQKHAARQFLAVMYHHRLGPDGKTFLMKELIEFLSLHGNEFELDKGV